MILTTWGDVIVASLQQVWTSVVQFIPLLLGAVLVFLVGWVIATALGKLVEQIIRALKIDELLAKFNFEKPLMKLGWKLHASTLIGTFVKWFLIVVFLLAAVNILGLTQVSDFLTDILLYIPNIVVAAIILIIAALVSGVVEQLVRGSVEAAGYGESALVGVIARWSIWIFAFVAVLLQLGIAAALVQTLITGFVAAIAIALGLSFGLGGKDTAAAVLDKVRSEIKGR